MAKLLWLSPLSVHDSASTSATQMRNMLLSLKARNVDIVALSSLCFVHESGTSMFNNLDENLSKSQENSFNLNDNNINFIYMRTKSRRLGDMSSQEQRAFYAKFCGIINAFKPDVVMGSGSDMLSMVCFDEAKRRGLPTVYTLLDGTPRRFNFPNIDVVITDSNAISSLYAKERQINTVVTGSFLPISGNLFNDDEKSQEQEQEQEQELSANKDTNNKSKTKGKKAKNIKENKAKDERYRITMINPTVEKGVGIFTQLANMAQKHKDFKNYQFTVYEAYSGQFKEQIQKVHYQGQNTCAFDDAMLKHIEIIDPSVKSRDILKQSKVLVIPSLSFESIVNIAREAIANNIPVLATNQMGLAESIGQAGVLVEPPHYCLQDPSILPSDEDGANFLKGLNIILNQDFTSKCIEVSKSFDINLSGNRLATILKPLFDKRAGNNPQLLRNGSLI